MLFSIISDRNQLFSIEFRSIKCVISVRSKLFFHGISNNELFVWVEAGLEQAVRWTEVLFQNKAESLALLSDLEVKLLFRNAPFITLPLVPGLKLGSLCCKIKMFKKEGMDHISLSPSISLSLSVELCLSS